MVFPAKLRFAALAVRSVLPQSAELSGSDEAERRADSLSRGRSGVFCQSPGWGDRPDQVYGPFWTARHGIGAGRR